MAKVKEYGSLTLDQQAKLMQEIDGLAKVSDEDEAKRDANGLIDFLFALREHGFITTAARVRYLNGIEDAMARRRECYKEKKI